MTEEKTKSLILIQSTDATIEGFINNGLWDRQRSTIEFYSQYFRVLYYTSDHKNYQDQMPANVTHVSFRYKPKEFGIRHIMYYSNLLSHAFRWRRKNAVIRVFGVTIPCLRQLKQISGKKLVLGFQYDWGEQTKKNYKNIKHYVASSVQKAAITSADFILCTMEWLYKVATEKYAVPTDKCLILPNYVNLQVFVPEKKEKTVTYAGRLHWSKGVSSLVKAFKLWEINGEYKLNIFGGGEEAENLKQIADNSPNIKFFGPVSISKYAPFLNASEIFVLPTVTMEGHPKALIEAMAAGCKCLASSVPGNKEVLTECGIPENLFEPNNVNSLLEALQRSVQLNADKSTGFAKTHYSRDIILKREVNILNDLIK